MIGLGFLSAASVAYLVGWTTVGAVLGGIVAALALLAAVTGFCAGCNAYKLVCALTGHAVRLVPAAAAARRRLSAGYSSARPQSSTTRQPSGSATVMLRPSQYGFSGSTSG